MIQLLIFLALGIFVAVLMRKKRHKPNKKFSPKPTNKSFGRNPNNKKNLRGIIKNEKTTTNFISDIGAKLHSKC